MSVHSLVLAALEPLLNNTWANELPPNPSWPAAMFEVATVPEETWVQGGGYDQHEVTVYVMSRSKVQTTALAKQFSDALEVLPQLLSIGESGDADYEDDADVYAVFITYTLRLRRY